MEDRNSKIRTSATKTHKSEQSTPEVKNRKLPFFDESGTLRQRFRMYWYELPEPRGIALVGPPGTGKSSLVEEVAGKDLITFTASETSPTDFLGYMRLQVNRMRWFKGLLLKSATLGLPFFIDEIDSLSKSAFTLLMSACDHRRQITIPGMAKTIQVHPNWRFVCAYNGQSGYDPLPRAFRDRLCFLHVSRLSRDSEVKLLIDHTAMPEEDANYLVRIAEISRRFDDANGISFRALLAAAEAMECGLPRQHAVNDCILTPMCGTDWSSREAFLNTLRAEGIDLLEDIADLRDARPIAAAVSSDANVW